jgi:hypothetical protein
MCHTTTFQTKVVLLVPLWQVYYTGIFYMLTWQNYEYDKNQYFIQCHSQYTSDLNYLNVVESCNVWFTLWNSIFLRTIVHHLHCHYNRKSCFAILTTGKIKIKIIHKQNHTLIFRECWCNILLSLKLQKQCFGSINDFIHNLICDLDDTVENLKEENVSLLTINNMKLLKCEYQDYGQCSILREKLYP